MSHIDYNIDSLSTTIMLLMERREALNKELKELEELLHEVS